jgi:putative endonuclease
MSGYKNIDTGNRGEKLAVSHLLSNGYSILECNFRSKGGEVDIVARDKDSTIVFVEVKSRTSLVFGPPQLAVTLRKQRQISKGALSWLSKNKMHDKAARFDVIAILLHDASAFEIEHIVNAFDLSY